MKNFIRILFLAGLLVPQLSWGKLVFICHKGLGYNLETIKRSYTGQLDEAHMVDNKGLKPELLTWVNHTELSYKRMWTKQYFRRAITPPILKDNDEAVVHYVANHNEGLGYVSEAPTNNPAVEVCGEK